MIGFDGPLLVRLEARIKEGLGLDAEPKQLLLKSLEARVGFEPTYRGFADLEKLTNNSFTFRVAVFCSVSSVRFRSALSDLGSGKATCTIGQLTSR